MTESRRVEIVDGDYVGEVLCSTDGPPIYYYVLQRRGSLELLALGQTRSFADAENQLKESIADFREMDQRSQAADPNA